MAQPTTMNKTNNRNDQPNQGMNPNNRRGPGSNDRRRNNQDRGIDKDTGEYFEEKVVQVSRVSKKTKGGNQMSFSILVVVGDKKGRVGVGLGKGKDVVSAIKKGVKKGKKNLITVPMDGATIPFRVLVKEGSAQIMLKPAPKGSGVIAGGPVRAVVEAAGIRDLSSKILGTDNQASNVYATFAALKEIQRIVTLKGMKLKSISETEAEEAAKLASMQEKAQEHAKADKNLKPSPTAKAKVANKESASVKKASAPQPEVTKEIAKK